MIHRHHLTRAAHIIDNSGIVDTLISGYRTSRRGRPANRNGLRLMLLGLLLSIHRDGKATLAAAHELLTTQLSLDDQLDQGIVKLVDDTPEEIVTIYDFYNLERIICERLAYSTQSEPDIDDSERKRRHSTIETYCNDLMDMFNIVNANSGTVAIDATGIWSWGRGFSTNNSTPDTPQPERRRDVDASWGIKTAKNGDSERYFGFAEHTLVQAPDVQRLDDGTDQFPKLITRFALTAASDDIVDVTLKLIDQHPTPVRDILVDRHYSYKAVDRWKKPLIERGINQHLDLRADEQGFEESDRFRWAAGQAHCPATPDHLGTIIKPAPDSTHNDWVVFHKRIEQRTAFAMAPHSRPDNTGTHRCVCPAAAGKIGCPLRPETMIAAHNLGLDYVETPPTTNEGEPLPAPCTQQTVKVTPPSRQLKLSQPHTWGSPTWRAVTNNRTYVEGSYGNRKNPSTENLRRGLNQVFGLVWTHIVMGLVNASYNLRMIDNWCERHPDHNIEHPLTTAAQQDTIGHLHLTAEEFATIIANRNQQAA